MIKGDIDNKTAPIVVIDIDDLIIDSKTGEVIERVFPILERFIYLDILVYLFAHRDKSQFKGIEEKLDDYPYNKLVIGGIKEREALLRRKDVHLYYYKKPEHSSILGKHKEIRVGDYSGISL